MLAEPLVERVFRMLSEGRVSQRRIASFTGVSRGTVGAIARGRRRLDLRPKCADADPLRPLGPPAQLPRLRRDGVSPLPALPGPGTGRRSTRASRGWSDRWIRPKMRARHRSVWVLLNRRCAGLGNFLRGIPSQATARESRAYRGTTARESRATGERRLGRAVLRRPGIETARAVAHITEPTVRSSRPAFSHLRFAIP